MSNNSHTMLNLDPYINLLLKNNFIEFDFIIILGSFHPRVHLIMFSETLSSHAIRLGQNWLKQEFRNLTK